MTLQNERGSGTPTQGGRGAGRPREVGGAGKVSSSERSCRLRARRMGACRPRRQVRREEAARSASRCAAASVSEEPAWASWPSGETPCHPGPVSQCPHRLHRPQESVSGRTARRRSPSPQRPRVTPSPAARWGELGTDRGKGHRLCKAGAPSPSWWGRQALGCGHTLLLTPRARWWALEKRCARGSASDLRVRVVSAPTRLHLPRHKPPATPSVGPHRPLPQAGTGGPFTQSQDSALAPSRRCLCGTWGPRPRGAGRRCGRGPRRRPHGQTAHRTAGRTGPRGRSAGSRSGEASPQLPADTPPCSVWGVGRENPTPSLTG